MTKKWLLLGMLVAAAPAQAATVIKLGHGANENFHMSRAMVEFERLVEEGSDGEIDVQIFPSSQMGPDRAMIEGVQTGILEMAVSPSSFAASTSAPQRSSASAQSCLPQAAARMSAVWP